MKLPATIVILGQKMHVAHPPPSSELDARNLLGRIDVQKGMIWLEPDQSPDSMKDTLLHEVLHGLIELGKTRDLAKLDDDEPFVAALASVLYDTLRRNPELVAYLMSDG